MPQSVSLSDIRFPPESIYLRDVSLSDIEGIGIGMSISDVPPFPTNGSIPLKDIELEPPPEQQVGIATVEYQQITRSQSLPEQRDDISDSFDTHETLMSEPAPDVDSALSKTFLPSLEPGAVLPLGEATAFMDIAEPTTGLADDPFRNVRTIMNLGFMSNPTTMPFAGFSLAGAALEGVEQPTLGFVEELNRPNKFDTAEVLMSEVNKETPLFSKIVGDLEMLYLVGVTAKSVGDAEKIVERLLRADGRRLDAKTVEEFLEKSLLDATEKDVREIISARQATNNRVSGKKFIDELKAKGLGEEAARWKRFMIEERQAGAEHLQTAVINEKIRGELPEVSKSTMDAVYPVNKDIRITEDFIQKDLGEGFTGSIPRKRPLVTEPSRGGPSEPPLVDEFDVFPNRIPEEQLTAAQEIKKLAVAIVKKKRSEPSVSIEGIDVDVYPDEIKSHNSLEFDELEPAFVRAKDELSRVSEQEIKLADIVLEVDGIAPPPGGLSTRKVGRPTQKELDEFKFEDTEIEKRFTNARGVPKVTFKEKMGEKATTLKNRSTRVFEELPRGAKYAELSQDLIRLQKKEIQGRQTIRLIEGVTKKLGKAEDNVFSRKILLDDLSFEAAEGRQIPFGFTPEEVYSELSRLDSVIARIPEIGNAIKARHELWESVRADLIENANAVGIDLADRFKNPAYFRHQVLEYARSKGMSESKIKKPSSGYLKTRGGSQLDINTNYIEAEYEVLANMLHDIEMYKFWGKVKKFDVKKSLVKEHGDGWRKNIPEGMSRFQFDEGHFFYNARTIPERIANELLVKGLEQVGIGADDIGTAMAIGGLKSEVVLPTELANTLRDPFPDAFVLPGAKAIKAWKGWAIGSPRRTMRFNMRNMTGDLEAVFIGNPRALAETAWATKALWQVFHGNHATDRFTRNFIRLGGPDSTLSVQELYDLNKVPNFKHIRDVKTPVSGMPVKVWKKYWEKTQHATNYRESVLRLSNFKTYALQMEKSPIGAPANFGASIPEEVMAIPGVYERAYKLSNDLLGAYDEITVIGRSIRKHFIPFWSFKEINMKRYTRLAINASNDKRIQEMLGRIAIEKNISPGKKDLVLIEVEPGISGITTKKKQAAVLAGKLTAKAATTGFRISAKAIALTGKFLVSAMMLWAITNASNMTFFPDIEEELPENVRERPHIIFGRKKNGKPSYFSRIGVLGDFLELFGLEAFPSQMKAWSSGEKTLPEILNEMWKSPVNAIFGSSRPLLKLMFEVAGRRTYFPDVFEPRTIRDRGYHIARSFALGAEYVALMRLPSEGYMETMSDFFSYSVDPGSSAYFEILNKRNRFVRKVLGKQGEGFFVSPKGNALYNFKLAQRLGDENAKKRYLNEYVKLSGVTSDTDLMIAIERSIEAADPLFGLDDMEKALFISTLKGNDKDRLTRALHYYYEIIKGVK